MLKEIMQEIIAAEEEAKRLTEQAMEQARQIVDDAEAAAAKIIADAKESAFLDEKATVASSKQDARAIYEAEIKKGRGAANLIKGDVDGGNIYR